MEISVKTRSVCAAPGMDCRMNSNPAGANNTPCAASDNIPAALRKLFLDIWVIRIAQKSLFFYCCNLLRALIVSGFCSFESIPNEI